MIKELINLNYYAVCVYFCDKDFDKLVEYLSDFDAVLPRINPGQYSGFTKSLFIKFLQQLSDNYNVLSLTNYSTISKMGNKDILYTLRHSKFGLSNTQKYVNINQFQEIFPREIKCNARVIKYNSGSQGEGIWVCKQKMNVKDTDKNEISVVNVYDNTTTDESIDSFISGFKAYFDDGGIIIDQQFLPRIDEGEVRLLMMFDCIAEIVHKKPKPDHLSATLKSGAKYVTFKPYCPEFKQLCMDFDDNLDDIMKLLGVDKNELPPLWTADFIMNDSGDGYVLGEINCSCVGITRQLHLIPKFAKLLVETIENKSKYDQKFNMIN